MQEFTFVFTNGRSVQHKDRVILLRKCWNRIQTINQAAIPREVTIAVNRADMVCTLVCLVPFVHRLSYWVTNVQYE